MWVAQVSAKRTDDGDIEVEVETEVKDDKSQEQKQYKYVVKGTDPTEVKIADPVEPSDTH